MDNNLNSKRLVIYNDNNDNTGVKNYFEVKFFKAIKKIQISDEMYEIFSFQGNNYDLCFKRGNQGGWQYFLFHSNLLSKLKDSQKQFDNHSFNDDHQQRVSQITPNQIDSKVEGEKFITPDELCVKIHQYLSKG